VTLSLIGVDRKSSGNGQWSGEWDIHREYRMTWGSVRDDGYCTRAWDGVPLFHVGVGGMRDIIPCDETGCIHIHARCIEAAR
jgi:hypothetical protein